MMKVHTRQEILKIREFKKKLSTCGRYRARVLNVINYLASFRVRFGWKLGAGLLSFHIGRWPIFWKSDVELHLHLLVKRTFWRWGRRCGRDGYREWCAGPFFMLVRWN